MAFSPIEYKGKIGLLSQRQMFSYTGYTHIGTVYIQVTKGDRKANQLWIRRCCCRGKVGCLLQMAAFTLVNIQNAKQEYHSVATVQMTDSFSKSHLTNMCIIIHMA